MKFTKGTRAEHQSIPDEDVMGWMKTLRDGGFSDEEIDTILVYANKTYRQEKGGSVAERKAHAAVRALEKYGQRLSDEAIQNLIRSFEVHTKGQEPWTQDE